MAEESGSFERVKSAWFTPQIIMTVISFLIMTFVQWKVSDYRLGKVEEAVAELSIKLDRAGTSADLERLEWARASTRMEAKIEQLRDQVADLRETTKADGYRIGILERKVR